MLKLPELNSEYKLTHDQISQYQRDGHILLRNVCSKAEIAAFRSHIAAVVAQHAKKQKDLSERDTYGKAFLQIGNLWKRNEAVKKFVFARRFAQIAARLAGANAIQLYHDQALFKEGFGGLTPWHQDQFYWPLDTSQSLTLWMPLVDVSASMGSMDFASGSHKNGRLKDIPISDESDSYFKDYIKNHDFRICPSGEMRAGDATFHNGLTLHGAAANKTGQTREVMTIIYYPAGTKLLQPGNANQQIDFNAFYPGLKPGHAAANEQTPVLYSEP
ncbi:MAG: phytanoyl-CoA dioxygenase family protein [Calditrichaeota bacterium]|nr:MAG: phytanoyl-CoA dioxygenase family protein [Calditrichota bacterium]